MALKESLIHFANTDGYSTVMTKADYDSNMDKLADEIDTKVDKVFSMGNYKFQRFFRFAIIDTTDATETIIKTDGSLKNKAMYVYDVDLQALQDDYTTKYIVRGQVIATIKDDGTITITKALNDIVKDDTDWAFDATGNNGDSTGGASVDFKVTGKDSTNIKWTIKMNVKRITY